MIFVNMFTFARYYFVNTRIFTINRTRYDDYILYYLRRDASSQNRTVIKSL